MKKYWQVIGFAAIATAVLYYPALRLYQYMKSRTDEKDEKEADHHVRAFFSPAYRGKHKPHHRSAHNGHGHNHDVS